MRGLVGIALGRDIMVRSEKHSRKVILVSENHLLGGKFDKKTKQEAVARVQAWRGVMSYLRGGYGVEEVYE